MRRERPRLSVVVPSRDRAHLLGRALQSVLSQAPLDIEVIVVDDGSSDDTADVAARFERVAYIRNPVPAGVSAARNRGAAAARGEWLLFLDDDDELLPRAMDALLRHIGLRHDLCLYYLDIADADGTTKVPRHQFVHDRAETADLLALGVRPISASQMVFRASLFERLGGFDEALRTGNDLDMWLRALLVPARLTVLQDILVRKHEHSESQLTRNLPQACAGHRAFRRKWRPLLAGRLPQAGYFLWYARSLDGIFYHHCGPGPKLAVPLSRWSSLVYAAAWLRVCLLAPPPIRSDAAPRALSAFLRAVLGPRVYAAVSMQPGLRRATRGFYS